MTNGPISRVAIIGTGQMGPTIRRYDLGRLPDDSDLPQRRIQGVEARAPWGPVRSHGASIYAFRERLLHG